MNYKFLNLFSKLKIIWAFSVFIFNIGQAQDTSIIGNTQNTEITYVRWVRQFPSSKSENKSPGIIDRMTNILFGKKVVELSKPISILAKDPDTYIVLDQGNGTILQIHNKLGEITQFLDKKVSARGGSAFGGNFFKSLIGICSIPNSEILFTDSHLNKFF